MTSREEKPAAKKKTVGLRWRIAALAGLVAVLSVSSTTMLGVRAIRSSMETYRNHDRIKSAEDLDSQIHQLTTQMAYEISDYASWTELYQQMPQPGADWVGFNLIPGAYGGLVDHYAIVRDDQVVGRYRAGRQYRGPNDEDPVLNEDLLELVQAHPGQGLANLQGRPALVAFRPILTSEGEGPAAGTLIGITFIDRQIMERLHLAEWKVTFRVSKDVPERPVGDQRWPGLTGGVISAQLHEDGDELSIIALRANDVMTLGGLLCVLVSAAIGSLLGLHWVRPLSALAWAARRRAVHPEETLPNSEGLREAQDLHEALDTYAAAEARHREALGAALDREAVANTVHRRFLSHLAHEIAGPVERIAALFEAEDAGQPVDQAMRNRVRSDALRLEERLHEALGLAADIHGPNDGAPVPREIGEYLLAILELMEPLARSRQRSLTIDADPGELLIHAKLLTPILVNLVANALRAEGNGPVIISARAMPDDSTIWRVSDPGPGMSASLAGDLREAFSRGEVMPGTPGIGLGLAVVVANARALNATVSLERTGPGGTTIAVTVPPGDSGAHYRQLSTGTARFRRRGS